MAPAAAISQESSMMSPEDSFRMDSEESFEPVDERDPQEILAERAKARKQKIIVVLSAIILVSMVMAISISMLLSEIADPEHAPGGPGPSSSLQKIQALCSLTDYRDLCISSISSYSGLHMEDPRDLIMYSIQAASDSVAVARRMAIKLAQTIGEGCTRWALSDCDLLLRYAYEELRAARASMDGDTVMDIPGKIEDIVNYLSAAVTYQWTCSEGLQGTNGGVRDRVTGVLRNGTEMSRNSLAMMSEVPLLDELLNEGKFGRKLLSDSRGIQVERSFLKGCGDFQTSCRAFPAANVVVAKDGSGDFQTISEALKAVAKVPKERRVIRVKEGVYEETVSVTPDMRDLVMIGDAPENTIITGNRSFNDGLTEYRTATFVASGSYFTAVNITFENTAAPHNGVAVAILVESDHAAFFNCHISSHNRPVYAHTHRQFYRNCLISGSIDLIAGDATSVFQNCTLQLETPPGIQRASITAQARLDKHQTTGTTLHNCSISGSQGSVYLGHPTGPRARVVVAQTEMSGVVEPQGWWAQEGLDVKGVFYGEFENRGDGASLRGRIRWPGFHAMFIQGMLWLNKTGVPYYLGLLPT
ncbi:hypothetical protein AMTRI_Chr13g90890 [Amborella trichopoda]